MDPHPADYQTGLLKHRKVKPEAGNFSSLGKGRAHLLLRAVRFFHILLRHRILVDASSSRFALV